MNSAIVVGGGIVGLASALQLRRRFPAASITLLEKEKDVGCHQSTHNSGVLHCGLYYKPGSLKARLAVSGIREMTAFCRQHEIAHDICGKLVVAVDESELPRLDELLRRGEANGLVGLKRLDRQGMLEFEPHVGGIAAAHVPEEGIVDYRGVVDAMHRLLLESNVEVVTRARVVGLKRSGGSWIAEWDKGTAQAKWLLNTAGLNCDRVGAMAGMKHDIRIIPFRGEYYRLSEEAQRLCRNLIYPVPDPTFPFLGVHFTRMIHGGIEAGPNAVLAFSREGYRMRDINLRDLWDAISFPGLWKFLRKYPNMTRSEIAQSFSKRRFCQALQRLIPEIEPKDLAPGGAGVRAQAMSPQGDLVQDFHIERGEYAIHLLNAPSPAATASLAIGRHLAESIDL